MELLQQVFDLVKTFNNSERNNFLTYANLKGKSDIKDYVKLFHLLDEQKELVSSTIKDQYQLNGKLNQLSNDLNYLEEQLLNSFLLYKNDQLYKIEVFNNIKIIEVLIVKKCYKIALKIINKTIEKLEQNDNSPVLIVLYEYKNFCNFYIKKENNLQTKEILKKLVDISYEIYIQRKIYYNAFEFGQSKIEYDKLKSVENLKELNIHYKNWNQLFKSIDRKLLDEEILLFNKVLAEYYFSINNYIKALKYIKQTILIVEKDINTEIQAFWLYIKILFDAFDTCCLANKKIIAKIYIIKAENYAKLPIIKNDKNHLNELNKFILKLKIQYLYYFNDYLMLNDYAVRIPEIESKTNNFGINSLEISKLQIAIAFVLNNQLDKAYDITISLNSSDLVNEKNTYKITTLLIKILFEINNKQFNVADYSIKNLYRYIQQHSQDKTIDKLIYKAVTILFKQKSNNQKVSLDGILEQLIKGKTNDMHHFIISYLLLNYK